MELFSPVNILVTFWVLSKIIHCKINNYEFFYKFFHPQSINFSDFNSIKTSAFGKQLLFATQR